MKSARSENIAGILDDVADQFYYAVLLEAKSENGTPLFLMSKKPPAAV